MNEQSGGYGNQPSDPGQHPLPQQNQGPQNNQGLHNTQGQQNTSGPSQGGVNNEQTRAAAYPPQQGGPAYGRPQPQYGNPQASNAQSGNPQAGGPRYGNSQAGNPQAGGPQYGPPMAAPRQQPQAPVPYYQAGPAGVGPIGKVRPTGTCILLMIVTLGFYSIFWYYGVCSEMQRHRNSGIGGGVAIVLALLFPIALPFITSSEAGALYAARRQPEPVSGVTGCWVFLPLIGSLIWFAKTNEAINRYWESIGA